MFAWPSTKLPTSSVAFAKERQVASVCAFLIVNCLKLSDCPILVVKSVCREFFCWADLELNLCCAPPPLGDEWKNIRAATGYFQWLTTLAILKLEWKSVFFWYFFSNQSGLKCVKQSSLDKVLLLKKKKLKRKSFLVVFFLSPNLSPQSPGYYPREQKDLNCGAPVSYTHSEPRSENKDGGRFVLLAISSE